MSINNSTELAKFLSFPSTTSAKLLALFLTALAFILSSFNIYLHLFYYNSPKLQKPIIRILFLVPFYSLFSILSLLFPRGTLLFDSVRDVWEALVLYSFLNLIIYYCGGENNCLSELMLPSSFLRKCKRATIQFVVIKPIFAVLNIAFFIFAKENSPQEKKYNIVSIIVYNVSYTVALYYLVLFYVATKNHSMLKDRRPLTKFLSVKLIIFATYYQKLIFEIIPIFRENNKQDLWNNFVLCCEMPFFSILQIIAFSYREFKLAEDNDAVNKLPKFDRIGDDKQPKNIFQFEIDKNRIKEVMSWKDVAKDAYYNFNNKYDTHLMLETENEGHHRFSVGDENSEEKNKNPFKRNVEQLETAAKRTDIELT